MSFRIDFESVVLAAMENGPIHGYGIVQAIREHAADVFKTGESQLYPILKRLESRGLVSGTWSGETGSRQRRLYCLTDAGLARLGQSRNEWAKFRKAGDRLLGTRSPESA